MLLRKSIAGKVGGEGSGRKACCYFIPEAREGRPIRPNESKGLPGGRKACLLKGTAGTKALRLEAV